VSLEIESLHIADPAEAWTRAGFRVDSDVDSDVDSAVDHVCRVGGVRVRLIGRSRGSGIVGWTLRGLPPGSRPADVDGIPTASSQADAPAPAAHPNGVTAIDHVVLMSPDLDRTVRALVALGVHPRRERDAEIGGRPIRQIFFRFSDVVIEVVGSPGTTGTGPATLWGITYVVSDIDATAAFLDERTTAVKQAVQPGRRITTLRHQDVGMSVRTAMISPRRDR
jgi:hypothetical protein